MKYLMMSISALSLMSSAFANPSAPAVTCFSVNGPIKFVAKGAVIDAANINAGEGDSSSAIDMMATGSNLTPSPDYSNRWNTAISDATLDLQKAPNGDLNGTLTLTDLRKATINAEFSKGGACISGIALSVGHYNDKLYGGTAKLFLGGTTTNYINLKF